MRILVVDDSSPVRRRLVDLLRETSGVEMHEAGDAAQARRFIGTMPVDLAILDIHLGRDSGLDLIGEVKRQQPEARVVVLTNDPTDVHRRECLTRGADFFFDKSRDFERVADVVLGVV